MAVGDEDVTEASVNPKGSTNLAAVQGPPPRGMPGRPPEDGVGVRPASATGRHELFATRSFAYGDAILQEAPLLCIPQKAGPYLKSIGTDDMINVAKNLGDAQRLAVFAAFSKLPEAQREAILSMGVSAGSTVVRDTKNVIGMFLKDCPQFADVIDWDLFARVIGVMSDRGAQFQNGDRVLYRLVDQAAHSCAPNAVIETLGDSKLKEVRAISHAGICEGEAITVSYVPEEVLMLPLEKRQSAIKETRGGFVCYCKRCSAGEDPGEVLPLLQHVSALRKDMDESTLREHIQELGLLDEFMPFALVGKARSRAKLAQACEEFQGGVLWEESAKLYEAAADETSIVLGQKGLNSVSNLKRRLANLNQNLE